ncbi:MAG: tRNA dihydrouridine(20/20a) synthase DusA [Gammaproteobacteria bacterium]|nr:tRNA dihydrouridine(20/20a) synthase DusA [Gammaproteobacteria bacterium]
MQILNRTLCVAPMMDWTDRHCRYFHRLLAPDALLYTEMVTTGALIHGDRERHLVYNEEEHPVALQLGGSDPADLARCAVMAREYGYDEVNLNVGCPSDRVQKGRFGACLMLEPALVRDCIAAMREAVDIPVTVKSRLGVDEQESYAFFSDFIGQVAESGCQTFIVHARKAWLSGLSPKQNREVPPLHYDRVLRLKDEHREFEIIVNGGIATVGDAQGFLEVLDGVMIGRAAYQEPWLLARLQRALFGREGAADREQIVRDMTAYLERHVAAGRPVKHVSRHLLGLFQGLPGAKRWRRYISEHAHVDPGNTRVLLEALDAMQSVRSGSAFVHGDGLE